MTAIPRPAGGEPLASAVPHGGGRRRRRRVLAAILLLVAVVAVVLVVTDPFGGGSSSGVRDNASPASLATVSRRSLTSLTLVSGTLGYTGDVTIDLPAGSAPTAVTQAQQAVTTDRGALASARSTLSSDAAALSQTRATLTADEQQEGVECTGDSAAQSAGAGGGASSSGSGACASDAQLVTSGEQSVTSDQARVAADEVSVTSAEHTLTTDEAAASSATAQAAVYGQSSAFTSLPSVGEIVRRGQRLLAIDGAPSLLLYGPTSATRAFSAGMSPGADVAELNVNLDALGYAHGLTGDRFTPATAAAIRRLQAAHSENATGQLLIGSVVFAPSPIRVTSLESTVAVGTTVTAGPVLTASGIARQIQIQLDPALQGQVRAGDPITITLPNDQTTPGRITNVSSVATPGQNGSSPTIAVDAVPSDPAAIGRLDQAPVNVSITTGRVSNALVVPVDALLSLESGGYAVEEVATNGVHHLVAVSTGLFDDADGLVQITGPGLAAGQRVVVPGL
jgi:hypothetical protein